MIGVVRCSRTSPHRGHRLAASLGSEVQCQDITRLAGENARRPFEQWQGLSRLYARVTRVIFPDMARLRN